MRAMTIQNSGVTLQRFQEVLSNSKDSLLVRPTQDFREDLLYVLQRAPGVKELPESDLFEACMVHVLGKIVPHYSMDFCLKSVQGCLAVLRSSEQPTMLELVIDKDYSFGDVLHNEAGLFQLLVLLKSARPICPRPMKRQRRQQDIFRSLCMVPFSYLLCQLAVDMIQHENCTLDLTMQEVVKLSKKLVQDIPGMRNSGEADAGRALFLQDRLVLNIPLPGLDLPHVQKLFTYKLSPALEETVDAAGLPKRVVAAYCASMWIANMKRLGDTAVQEACKVILLYNSVQLTGILDDLEASREDPESALDANSSTTSREALLRHAYPLLVHMDYLLIANHLREAIYLAVRMEKCNVLAVDDRRHAYEKVFWYLLEKGKAFYDYDKTLAVNLSLLLTLVPLAGDLGMDLFVDAFHGLADHLKKQGGQMTEAERTYIQYACHQTLLRWLRAKYNPVDGLNKFRKYWNVPHGATEQWVSDFLTMKNPIPKSLSCKEDGVATSAVCSILHRRSAPPSVSPVPVEPAVEEQVQVLDDDEDEVVEVAESDEEEAVERQEEVYSEEEYSEEEEYVSYEDEAKVAGRAEDPIALDDSDEEEEEEEGDDDVDEDDVDDDGPRGAKLPPRQVYSDEDDEVDGNEEVDDYEEVDDDDEEDEDGVDVVHMSGKDDAAEEDEMDGTDEEDYPEGDPEEVIDDTEDEDDGDDEVEAVDGDEAEDDEADSQDDQQDATTENVAHSFSGDTIRRKLQQPESDGVGIAEHRVSGAEGGPSEASAVDTEEAAQLSQDEGYIPDDAHENTEADEEEDRAIEPSLSLGASVDASVEIQSSRKDGPEAATASQPIFEAIVEAASANVDPGYEAEGTEEEQEATKTIQGIRVEPGYLAEDSQGHTEEEEEGSVQFHTEDEEEDRRSDAPAQEDSFDEPVPRVTSHTLSDMSAADDQTMGQEEELGESSELELGTDPAVVPARSSPQVVDGQRKSLVDYARMAQEQDDDDRRDAKPSPIRTAGRSLLGAEALEPVGAADLETTVAESMQDPTTAASTEASTAEYHEPASPDGAGPEEVAAMKDPTTPASPEASTAATAASPEVPTTDHDEPASPDGANRASLPTSVDKSESSRKAETKLRSPATSSVVSRGDRSGESVEGTPSRRRRITVDPDYYDDGSGESVSVKLPQTSLDATGEDTATAENRGSGHLESISSGAVGVEATQVDIEEPDEDDAEELASEDASKAAMEVDPKGADEDSTEPADEASHGRAIADIEYVDGTEPRDSDAENNVGTDHAAVEEAEAEEDAAEEAIETIHEVQHDDEAKGPKPEDVQANPSAGEELGVADSLEATDHIREIKPAEGGTRDYNSDEDLAVEENEPSPEGGAEEELEEEQPSVEHVAAIDEDDVMAVDDAEAMDVTADESTIEAKADDSAVPMQEDIIGSVEAADETMDDVDDVTMAEAAKPDEASNETDQTEKDDPVETTQTGDKEVVVEDSEAMQIAEDPGVADSKHDTMDPEPAKESTQSVDEVVEDVVIQEEFVAPEEPQPYDGTGIARDEAQDPEQEDEPADETNDDEGEKTKEAKSAASHSEGRHGDTEGDEKTSKTKVHRTRRSTRTTREKSRDVAEVDKQTATRSSSRRRKHADGEQLEGGDEKPSPAASRRPGRPRKKPEDEKTSKPSNKRPSRGPSTRGRSSKTSGADEDEEEDVVGSVPVSVSKKDPSKTDDVGREDEKPAAALVTKRGRPRKNLVEKKAMKPKTTEPSRGPSTRGRSSKTRSADEEEKEEDDVVGPLPSTGPMKGRSKTDDDASSIGSQSVGTRRSSRLRSSSVASEAGARGNDDESAASRPRRSTRRSATTDEEASVSESVRSSTRLRRKAAARNDNDDDNDDESTVSEASTVASKASAPARKSSRRTGSPKRATTTSSGAKTGGSAKKTLWI